MKTGLQKALTIADVHHEMVTCLSGASMGFMVAPIIWETLTRGGWGTAPAPGAEADRRDFEGTKLYPLVGFVREPLLDRCYWAT